MEQDANNIVRAVLAFYAVLAGVIYLYCDAIYDWGTRVVRNWGWKRIADMREKSRRWALPLSRAILVLVALGCSAGAVLL